MRITGNPAIIADPTQPPGTTLVCVAIYPTLVTGEPAIWALYFRDAAISRILRLSASSQGQVNIVHSGVGPASELVICGMMPNQDFLLAWQIVHNRPSGPFSNENTHLWVMNCLQQMSTRCNLEIPPTVMKSLREKQQERPTGYIRTFEFIA
ncbi:uncharacterized protein N7496_011698 [Penicillium cataractarum]|uniref:Uncharacterized protein n=1 Tax=Penicillium cataractarum TaxID=2100454 RepID=A0A9W9RFK6_9EURO|nr:uncharacterized protein N7496_011698 [Penicillium cataractarum]KAJ5359285.1 hypothetical protein N7496_011698 [Penicillium cataractarum]